MDEKEKVVIRDRRRKNRTQKPLKFRIIPEDASHDIVGETKDLSCIGAKCKMNKFIPELTKLQLTLELPHGKETFEGLVVRSDKINENEYDVAIYFSEIDFGIRKKIDSFVNGDEDNIQEFKIDD
jgi:hypothetical protein